MILATMMIVITLPLREKCPYSELFWFVFSRIRTEYRQIRSISLHRYFSDSVHQGQMRQDLFSYYAQIE